VASPVFLPNRVESETIFAVDRTRPIAKLASVVNAIRRRRGQYYKQAVNLGRDVIMKVAKRIEGNKAMSIESRLVSLRETGRVDPILFSSRRVSKSLTESDRSSKLAAESERGGSRAAAEPSVDVERSARGAAREFDDSAMKSMGISRCCFNPQNPIPTRTIRVENIRGLWS